MTPDQFMSRFPDGATRDATAYLMRSAGYLSGRSSPEKLLEYIRGPKLEQALRAVRSAVDADPQGALAKAAEVLAELADPRLSQQRQHEYATGGMQGKPPSEKQLKFLADLGHPAPQSINTMAEACKLIDSLKKAQAARQGGGRR